MATIENVNDRTILQQFHSLYKAVEEIKNKGINLNVKGQYENTTTYLQGDVVYNNGKAFYRINDGATTGIDTTNTEYWQMFFDAVTGLTGPQGPQGPQGPKGADGVGFNDATIIKVINDAITVDNTGINLEQTTEVTTQSNGIFEINTQSKLPIAGSDTVVVDLAEDGTHANIHLDTNITNKLAKTLVTPTSTPTATEIVAVDNTNSQTMLAIGDGLSVENGTLKASGGSGGSSSLYLHHIKISGYNGTFTLINDDPTAYTMTSLENYLKDKSYSNAPLDGFAYQLTNSYSTVGITFIYGFTFSGNNLVANYSNIFWNLTDGNINASEGGGGTKYVSISSDFVEQIL